MTDKLKCSLHNDTDGWCCAPGEPCLLRGKPIDEAIKRNAMVPVDIVEGFAIAVISGLSIAWLVFLLLGSSSDETACKEKYSADTCFQILNR